MTTKPRAIAYLRQSLGRVNETADDALSLDAQLAAISRYCQDRGYTIVRTVRDHDLSGENWHRPGITELLDVAEKGEADVAVVFKMSRLSRDGLYQELTHRELKNRGVTLESVTEAGIDKPLIRMVYGGMAQQANEDHREWMRAMIATRARRGLHHGRPPYGYRIVFEGSRRNRLEVVEDEAAIVRRMYERRIAGVGCITIANELNRDGIPSATGAAWQSKTVSGIIKSPTYTGYSVNNGEIVGDLNPAHMPAIIDRTTWQEAQRSFRPGRRIPRRKDLVSWLEGCVTHGCGAAMWLTTNEPGYVNPVFRCCRAKQVKVLQCDVHPKRVPQHALETATIMALGEDLATAYRDPDVAVRAIAATQHTPHAITERDRLRRQRTQTLESIKRAEGMVYRGHRDEAWLVEVDRELNAELVAIDDKLNAYVDVPEPADLVPYIAALDDLAASLELARPDDLRRLLLMLGGVRYDRGVLTIDYADPFALLIPNPAKIELIYNPGGTRTGNTWQFRPLI